MTTLASCFFQSFPLWTFNYEWSTGRTCICPGSFNHFLKSTGGERFGWLIRNMGQHSIHEIQPQTVFSQKLEGANTNQGNLQYKNFSWRYKSLSLWHQLQVVPFTDKTKLKENRNVFLKGETDLRICVDPLIFLSDLWWVNMSSTQPILTQPSTCVVHKVSPN